VWTVAFLNLLSELGVIAHCNQEQARVLLEKILAFVQSYNELSESMVGKLLEQSGMPLRLCSECH
jgi:hypothetical protein